MLDGPEGRLARLASYVIPFLGVTSDSRGRRKVLSVYRMYVMDGVIFGFLRSD